MWMSLDNFTDNYVMLTMCTVYVAMCMFELQEPGLTPSVVATAEELADIFSGDSHVQLKTSADAVKISQPTNLFDGICSVMAVFWVFDIAFPCKMKKTMGFLADHVCKLEKHKPTAAMQRRLNILYSL